MTPVPKVAAGVSVTDAALTYDMLRSGYMAVHDQAPVMCEIQRKAWGAVMESAAFVLSQPPRSPVDIVVQLALAASWINTFVEQQDDGPDHALLTGIETALDNAVYGLAQLHPVPSSQSPLGVMLATMLADISRSSGATNGVAA